MKRRSLYLTTIAVAAISLTVSILVNGPAGYAFVVPGNAEIGAGSRWEYDSNLGPVVVEMVDKVDLPPRTFYRWRLSLRGLVYEEWLELQNGQLLTWERSFSAFGLLKEKHSYPQPEYTMPAPPTAGARWSWQGAVSPEPLGAEPWKARAGPPHQTLADGRKEQSHTAAASGHVHGIETVETPAGRFSTYHIYLERSDSLGTEQTIEIWLDPNIGVIAAEGDLHWAGLPGKIQRLIGLEHLSVRLRKYQLK
ncbi:MAG: hypothetical protein IMX00_08235 [Limnochordales bacterium]|nr:hypothetical protein [Limnochordales bacterium]